MTPPPGAAASAELRRGRRFAVVSSAALAIVAGGLGMVLWASSPDGSPDPSPGGADVVGAPGASPSGGWSGPAATVPAPTPVAAGRVVDPGSSGPAVAPASQALAQARACEPTGNGAVAVPDDAASTSPAPRQLAGRALLSHPAIRACPPARESLNSGAVDGPVLAVLALLADRWSYRLAIVGAPQERTVLLMDLQEAQPPAATSADPSSRAPTTSRKPPAAAAAEWLRSQEGPFAPELVEELDPTTVLVRSAPVTT